MHSMRPFQSKIGGGVPLLTPRRPCLACVVEKPLNLGGHGGHDGAVEQQIQSAEQECADNYSDENLYAGIDITLSLLASNSRSYRSYCGINLVSDFLKATPHKEAVEKIRKKW